MDWPLRDFQHLLLSPGALAVLGLCVGSFLNVVVYRVPRMMERHWKLESAELLGLPPPIDLPPELSLWRPPSRCSHCGHGITWYENIPLVSWLALRGRCAACKTPIGLRYPLVEAGTGLLFALAGWVWGPQWTTLIGCAVLAVLLAAALIDWDTTLLPDDLTLPLLWAGLIAAAWGGSSLSLTQSLWGAVVGYLSLWSVYWLFKLTTGKEGMGYGDFKLLGALGAWLGVSAILPIVLASSVLGALIGIGMKVTGQLREGRFMPFGPFLAGAGAVVMLAGVDRAQSWMGW